MICITWQKNIQMQMFLLKQDDIYRRQFRKLISVKKRLKEKKTLTQNQLGEIINKRRCYISRVENDASNITLKTLYDIVKKGLGGKINIQIDL